MAKAERKSARKALREAVKVRAAEAAAAEPGSAERWLWTTLADAHVSSCPIVFGQNGRSVHAVEARPNDR